MSLKQSNVTSVRSMSGTKVPGRLQAILSGEALKGTEPSRTSPLAALSQRAPPGSIFLNSLTLLIVPYFIGLFASILATNRILVTAFLPHYPILADHLELTTLVAGFAVSLVWFLLLFFLRQGMIKNLFSTLLPAMEELCFIRERLDGYIHEIDHRTTSMVHCVTTTKITNYFVLQQIRDAILRNLEQIEVYYQQGTIDAFYGVHKILSGWLSFQDGVVAGVGETYTIPLARVREVLELLTTDLEQGIRGLEGELAKARSGYTTEPADAG